MSKPRTIQEQRNLDKANEITSKHRKSPAKPLPPELSQFETGGVIDYFKMITLMETGTTDGWELVREDFIKQNAGKVNTDGIRKAIKSRNENMSKEDQVMNDMADEGDIFDTNGIIEQVAEGTVENNDLDKADKMQIIEGDMPGQGKEKQGTWRG